MLKPGDYVIIKTLTCGSSLARYLGIIGASLVCTEAVVGGNVLVSPAIVGGYFMPNMLLKIEKLPIQLYAFEPNSYVVFNTSLYLSVVPGNNHYATMYYASP